MNDGSKGIFGKVRKFTDQAGKMGREALKTAGSAKEVVHAGIESSKKAVEKAGTVVNRERVAQGIAMTSKGADVLAKGAKMASKGAEVVGSSMEKASDGIRQFSKKIKG